MSYLPNTGGQPPSFKTNVNRAKTKRWVEAKSYTYDGDDWGEADEYDEYGGYDETPPPSKPTGLRQQGQSAHSVPQPRDPYQRSMDNGGQMYGNVGPPQQYEQRSATNPQPRIDTEMARSNSFDRGDEKRAFSAGRFQPGITSNSTPGLQQLPYNQAQHPGPANVQPSMQFNPNQMRPIHPDIRHQYLESQARQHNEEPIEETDRVHDRSSNHRDPAYPDEPRYPSMGSRAQSMTSNTSSMDFHNRRDFTPSALPPPLHPKGSPTSDLRSSSTHPPRQSSLSQTSQPSIPPPNQVPSRTALPEPGAAARQRTSSGADKPLPFVRPADIYKRMQDEKQKDRPSQDSSRPSMDSIVGRPERFEKDSHPDLKERESGISPAAVTPTPSHVLDNIETEQHGGLLPRLDSLAERKSEYGLEGFDPEHRAPIDQKQRAGSLGLDSAPTRPQAVSQTGQNTLSPVLPEVARLSSFGDSFLGPDRTTGTTSLEDMLSSTQIKQPSAVEEPVSSSGLQHQPSSGFRSVVNQAFDITDDQIPPTPTSTVCSGVQRSTSGGTSVISPIISRGPSTAAPNTSLKNAGARIRTPSLPEEGEEDSSRPMSSDSIVTPRQMVERQSPSQIISADLNEASPPPTFIPGHRRDLSTPSPGNSPARTPFLEANEKVCQPQEAEVAMSNPTEPASPSAAFRQELKLRNDNDAPFTSSLREPRKRSQSPSKNRVRDLAGKFESASSSRRNSDQSLSQRGGTGATSPQRSDFPAPVRPFATDRMESFRPHLPGEWNSYTSNAPPVGAASEVLDEDSSNHPQRFLPPRSDTTDSLQFQDHSVTDLSGVSKQRGQSPLRQDNAPKAPSSSATAAHIAVAEGPATSNKTNGGQQDIDLNHTPSTNFKLEDRGYVDTLHASQEPRITTKKSTPADRTDQSTSGMADQTGALSTPQTPSDDFETSASQEGIPESSQPSGTLGMAKPQSEQATPLARPPTLSNLNTDDSSQYESDRLRREIFKSLTPNVASEPTTAESDSPYQDELRGSIKADVQQHHVAHEGFGFPREYDNYWNESGSISSSRSNSERVGNATPATVQQQPIAPADKDIVLHPGQNTLSPRLQRLVSESREDVPRPTMSSHRFSWEQATTARPSSQSVQQIAEPLEPDTRPLPSDSGDSPTFRQSSNDDGMRSYKVKGTAASEASEEQSPIYDNNLETVEHAPETTPPRKLSGPRISLDEPRTLDALPVAHSREAVGPLSGQDGGFLAVHTPQSAQPKIPAFREISALKTPAERIRGYNEAREQFAKQDNGLAHWLAVTSSEFPEHADVLSLSNAGRRPAVMMSHKPSSSRLLSGLRSAGQRSDGPDTANPGFGQSSSPTSGSSKLASQQVQAKGKDLLHSAGVFGGRANVAAKGLFSKGRSKFRGAGGGDKDSRTLSSPDQVTQGMQPRAQPATGLRNADSDTQTSNYHQSPQGRPLSYIERVDDPVVREDLSDPHHERTVLPSTSPSHEGYSGQSPIYVEPARAYPARSDSLAPAGNITQPDDRKLAELDPDKAGGNVPFSFDHTPAGAVAPEIAGEPHDLLSSTGESLARIGSKEQLRSSLPSEKRTSLQHHFASQAESIRDAIGPSPRYEPSLPKALSLPRSRFSSQQASGDGVVFDTAADRPILQQSGTDRNSEESSSSFHTAENYTHEPINNLSLTEDDLETPKAEKPPQFINQTQPDEPTASLRPSQDYSLAESRNIDEGPAELSKKRSLPSTQAQLAREPSLDNVSQVVRSDLPPSPVSPQHSFIQEPVRQQDRKAPIYYGPDHDFEPVPSGRTATAHPGAHRRHSRGPSLEDHPAFRQESAPPGQSQGLSSNERDHDGMPKQQQSIVESEFGAISTSRVPTGDAATRAKRNSRNSSFFGSFKSPTAATSRTSEGPDQGPVTPVRSNNDVQRKSKRNSLFGSRNGDRTNSSRQSEESSPAPTPKLDTSRQPLPVTPSPQDKGGASSGTSSKLHSKLQRASTIGNKEKESGKKKRFSAIGSLFGSRSRQAQSSLADKSKQSQPVTFYQFDQPQKPQESERQLQQQQPNTGPEYSESNPSFRQSNCQSSSTQPLHNQTPVQNSSQSPYEGYYAPGRTDSNLSATPTWSHTAQRVSQPQQPSMKEPPAYTQDAASRQRAAASTEVTKAAAPPTSATFPTSALDETTSKRSRSSIWSRSRSRDVPFSKRHDRSTSGNSWSTEEPNRQSAYSTSANQQAQPAISLPTTITPTHSGQGRVLTYSQFGESNISYPPPQSTTSNDPWGAYQPSQGRQQQPQPNNTVTFHQFPQQQSNDEASPPPPPPPPKDDWHVSRPQQSINPQALNSQPTQETHSSNHSQPHHQPTTMAQPHTPSQPPEYTKQPPPQSHSRTTSSSSQNQRQNLPPLQTETSTTRRSGAFSPGNTSAESRKARQRELEIGGTPSSAGRSALEPVRKQGESEEAIVMSSSSYPGMEWTPDMWEED